MTKRRGGSRLGRAVRTLFGPSRTTKSHNQVRYKHIYFDQRTYGGIAMLAMYRQQSTTAGANELMRSAIAIEMGEIIRQANQEELARREQGLPPDKPNKFIQELRRRAREQGHDVGGFI